MIDDKSGMGEELNQIIRSQIKDAIAEIESEAKRELDQKIQQIVSDLAMHIAANYSIERNGTEVCIKYTLSDARALKLTRGW